MMQNEGGRPYLESARARIDGSSASSQAVGLAPPPALTARGLDCGSLGAVAVVSFSHVVCLAFLCDEHLVLPIRPGIQSAQVYNIPIEIMTTDAVSRHELWR